MFDFIDLGTYFQLVAALNFAPPILKILLDRYKSSFESSIKDVFKSLENRFERKFLDLEKKIEDASELIDKIKMKEDDSETIKSILKKNKIKEKEMLDFKKEVAISEINKTLETLKIDHSLKFNEQTSDKFKLSFSLTGLFCVSMILLPNLVNLVCPKISYVYFSFFLIFNSILFIQFQILIKNVLKGLTPLFIYSASFLTSLVFFLCFSNDLPPILLEMKWFHILSVSISIVTTLYSFVSFYSYYTRTVLNTRLSIKYKYYEKLISISKDFDLKFFEEMSSKEKTSYYLGKIFIYLKGN